MRIALDSAILVRANQRAAGPARALLLELLSRGHILVISPSVIAEVQRVLRYPRLLKRFALTETEIAQFTGFLTVSAEMIEVDETIAAPIRDPRDIHILQTAISGKVEYLCTLDQHFYEAPVVAFCSNRRIMIVSDVDLLRVVRGF